MHRGIDLFKRALLRGRLRRSVPLTPPWAGAYQTFTELCTRCGECIAACPEQILSRGSGDFPAVDFDAGGCTFCGHCVEVCTTGALSKAVDPPWRQLAHIGDACLARRGVYCQSCRDTCDVAAIAFTRNAVDRVPTPAVDVAQCTGCGGCVSACPGAAIALRLMEENP